MTLAWSQGAAQELGDRLVDAFVAAVFGVLSEVFGVVPRLLAAMVSLAVGLVVAVLVGRGVARVARRYGLDGSVGADDDDSVSLNGVFGALASGYVVLVTGSVAASVLGVDRLVGYLDGAVGYAPSLVGGVGVVVLGSAVADRVGRWVTDSSVFGQTGPTVAVAVRGFTFLVAVTVGLDTAGVDVAALVGVVRALALGVALAVGLAVGLASAGYAGDDIAGWVEERRSADADTGGSNG
jgi:hypothetical protein